MHAGAMLLRGGGERLRERNRECRSTGPRVRVLEDQQGRALALDERSDLGRIHPPVGRPHRTRLQAGDLLDPTRLGRHHVRRSLDDDPVAGKAEREHRDEVSHATGRHPEAGGLPEERRHTLAQLVDGCVLPDGRPAQLRVAHRLPHRVGRERQEIRAEVDHIRPAGGAAPGGRPCGRPARRRRCR